MSDGRAERRRQERAQRKGLTIVSTGFKERISLQSRDQPATPGRHQWQLFVTYAIPDRMLDEIEEGVLQSDVVFDHENMVSSVMGCFVCAVTLTRDTARTTCPGDQ